MAEVSERQEQIVELYFRSNSVRFGTFELSAHRDNQSLPPSPYYLHYPKAGQPGSELMPGLHELIGQELYSLCESHDPPIRPKRIAGLPNGATPLGEAHARQYVDFPDNYLEFKKIEAPQRPTHFVGPSGYWQKGDEVLLDEDHTSAGRNKKVFLPVAQRAGLVVRNILTVVDRQQGGVEAMKQLGIDLLSIFTISKFMQIGVEQGLARQSDAEIISEYIASPDSMLITPSE